MIIPAIIPRTLRDLEEKVSEVASYTKRVHIDLCDGLYTKSLSWPYAHDWNDFEPLEHQDVGLPSWQSVDYEIHLMVMHPKVAIERWIRAGANSFVIQVERLTDSFDEILELVHSADSKLGISILPQTDIENHKDLIAKTDFIQCMGIGRIGQQGQDFDDRVFDQITKIKKLRPDVVIAVDGHVDLDNLDELVDVGANKFIVGSAIWKSESIPQAIIEFKQALE